MSLLKIAQHFPKTKDMVLGAQINNIKADLEALGLWSLDARYLGIGKINLDQ